MQSRSGLVPRIRKLPMTTTRRTFVQQLGAAAGTALWGRGLIAETGAEGAVAKAPLRQAMDRAAACCLAWLNPEQQFLPTGGYEIAHDTGRWWDAMLRYEAATGTRIPAPVEEAMMKNLRTLTDNPAALLMNTARLPGPVEKLKVNPHNLRETMLTYNALASFRKSEWAVQQGRKLVDVIGSLLEPDGQMDYEKLATLAGGPLTTDPLVTQRSPSGEWFNATATTGRAIEPILSYYETTGHAPALELAKRLAEVHMRQTIDPKGKVRAELRDPSHVGHTHSYCGTLRGLLLYGLISGEKQYIDAVASTYRKGLWGTSISHSGWTPHDQGKSRFTNRDGDPIGEHASCGDIAQIALWLALRAGQTDLLDDVERLVRARLLPSQIVDEKNPRRDGAWGVYSHPFGYGAILDVFAAVLHSLTDIDLQSVSTLALGSEVPAVHLHFDADAWKFTVESKRGPEASSIVTPKRVGSHSVPGIPGLEVTPKEAPPKVADGEVGLRIRVPSWATREKVQLEMAGKPLPLRWEGSYLLVLKKEFEARVPITLRHDLPPRQTVEEMPVSHNKFNLTWKGDEVVSCDPKVPIYPARA